jgi:hypothetical protein
MNLVQALTTTRYCPPLFHSALNLFPTIRFCHTVAYSPTYGPLLRASHSEHGSQLIIGSGLEHANLPPFRDRSTAVVCNCFMVVLIHNRPTVASDAQFKAKKSRFRQIWMADPGGGGSAAILLRDRIRECNLGVDVARAGICQ